MKKSALFLTVLLMALVRFGTSQVLLNEGFELDFMPPSQWTATSESPNPYFHGWVTNPFAHSGNKSAFIDYSASGYDDSGNEYDAGHDSYLITPQLNISGHKLLSFWYSVSYSGWIENESTTLTVEISTTTPSESQFVPVAVIPEPNSNNAFYNVFIDLGNYSGQNIYIAFHVVDNYGTGIYLDDVTVYDLPSCFPPFNLSVSDINATDATLSWTDTLEGNSYMVQYMMDGESWNNADSLIVNSTTAILTGLQASTRYQVRVKTLCGENESSAWSEEFSFVTYCEGITITNDDIWEEGFETEQAGTTLPLPNCWDTPVTSPIYESPFVSKGWLPSCHTGEASLELRGNYGESNIAVMPQFSNHLNSLRLTFYANTSAASISTSGTFQVGYMTDVNDPATFTVIETVSARTECLNRMNSVAFGPFDFLPAMNTQGRIAFRYTSNNYNTSWNLDDIEVMLIPECAEPSLLQSSNVTANSADVFWSVQENQLYDILYWKTNTTDTIVIDSIYLDNGPYTLVNLSPTTSYTWMARAVCNDGSYSNSVTRGQFTTPGVSVELPYTQSFAADEAEITEIHFSGSGLNQWAIGSATGLVDNDEPGATSRSMYISDNQGLTNNYSGDGYSYSYAAIDIQFPDEPMEFHLEFDFKVKGESSGSYFWDYFNVYMIDGSDILPTSGTPNGVALFDNLTNYNSWTHADVVLPNVPGTAKKIVFYWENDNWIYQQPPVAVDNISISGNSCGRPNQLVATDVQSNEVTLQWHEIGTSTSWNIYYRPFGTDVMQHVVVNDVTTFTLTGLIANTEYLCFVTSNCEDGQESNHSNPYVFRTLCSEDGITVLPYNESFSSTTDLGGNDFDIFVPCWTRIYSTWPYRPYVNTADFGNNCLDFNYTPNCYSIATLPVLAPTIPINSLMVSFDIWKQDLSASPLEVGAMTDPNDASTFVTIASIMPSVSETWENHSIYCNEYTGDGQYLAFRVNNSGNNSVVIDNLVVDNLPGCMPVTTILVNDITENTAFISWNGSENDSYNVFIYGPNNATYSVNGNYLTVSGLQPSSSYSVTVQKVCGDDVSLMSNPVGFFTACGLISVTDENPWVESFDNYIGTLNNIPLSNCWTVPISYQPVNSTVVYPAVLQLASAAHSGSNSMEMLGNTNLVVLPEFSNDINTLRVSFWGNTEAISNANAGHLEVGYITDITHLQTFTALAAFDPTAYGRTGNDSPNADFFGPFDFNSVAPQPGARIAIRYVNASPYFACNLDDFVVSLIPACPSPVKNSVTFTNITSNGATVNWTDNYSDHNSWTVHYKPSNEDDDSWMTVEANGITSANLTDLYSNTTYDVYVTTNCGGEPGTDATTFRHFTTPLTAVTLPYSTDFSEDNEWLFDNGSFINRWIIRSPTPTGSTRALFVTSNGLAPSYDELVTSRIAAEKLFKVGNASEIHISFDVKVGGEIFSNVDYDFMKLFLAPVEMQFESTSDNSDNHWGSATFTNYAYNFSNYQSYSGGNPSAPYKFSLTGGETVHIDAIMPNPYTDPTSESVAKLVFTWTNDASGYTEKPAAVIYNLAVSAINCNQPLNLAVQNIGISTADVTWDTASGQESWILTYKESSATDWDTIHLSTNSYHLTDLGYLTTYNVRVAVDCGEDGFSVWSETSFKTRHCEVEDQCTYTLYMADNYNDGWNGASLTILQNGIEIGNYTVPQGNTQVASVVLCDNTTTSLVWSKGQYDSECTFYLYNAYEDQIFTSPSLTQLSGVLYTFNTQCVPEMPVCEAPFGVMVTNIEDTSAYIDWFFDGHEISWVLQYATDTLEGWTTEEMTDPFFLFENLTSNTTYYVRIKAICGPNNESDWCETTYFTTTGGSIIEEPVVITQIAMDITDTSATLNGAILSLGNQPIIARGFECGVTNSGNDEIILIDDIDPIFEYTLTGLTPGTQYTYRAFATTANTTTYGNDRTFTTLLGAPCEKPTNLTVTDTTSHSLTISWTDVAGTDTWMVRYRTIEGGWTSVTTTENPYTIENLTETTTYEIQVRALCEDNYSSWTPGIYVTTSTVGIPGYLSNSIILYPNPTNDVITVECRVMNDEYTVTDIQLYDVYGKLINTDVRENNYSSLQTRINVSGLASGMYFVRVTTDKGAVTKTFVKN